MGIHAIRGKINSQTYFTHTKNKNYIRERLLENLVQFAIASGKLKHGDQLPSVKALAKQLGINPNTVVKAYRDLEVMGLVYARRGMGLYVEQGAKSKCGERCSRRIIERIHEITQEAKAAGLGKKKLIEIINKSCASDSGPYSEIPPEIAAQAKKK